MLTGRQAGRLLRDVLSSDEQARLLLRSGIAGPGTTTPGGIFYDEGQVHAVRLRPHVDEDRLARHCPHGLLVARLPRIWAFDLTRPWGEVARQVGDAVAQQRSMTPLTAALMGVRIRAWGAFPFAATLLGHVILTADLTRLGEHGPELGSAGPWAREVDGHWFRTPPGGRPAHLWTPGPF